MTSALLPFLGGLLMTGIPLVYQWWSKRPKLRGKIVALTQGVASIPNEAQRTSFIPYIYLANMRDVPVPVFDYSLQVRRHFRFWSKPLKPMYNLRTKIPLKLDSSHEGGTFNIDMDCDNLLAKNDKLIDKQNPLRGFLMFSGPLDLYGAKYFEFKLTCFDGFGGKHSIVTRLKDIHHPAVLQYMSEARLEPPKDPSEFEGNAVQQTAAPDL